MAHFLDWSWTDFFPISEEFIDRIEMHNVAGKHWLLKWNLHSVGLLIIASFYHKGVPEEGKNGCDIFHSFSSIRNIREGLSAFNGISISISFKTVVYVEERNL